MPTLAVLLTPREIKILSVIPVNASFDIWATTARESLLPILPVPVAMMKAQNASFW